MKKESRFAFLVGLGSGLGIAMGLFIWLNVFPPVQFKEYPYKLEMEKEYIALHVETTDFPMVVIDKMIIVLEDNGVKAGAIVFVKNRKPVSQIRLPEMKTEDEETK